MLTDYAECDEDMIAESSWKENTVSHDTTRAVERWRFTGDSFIFYFNPCTFFFSGSGDVSGRP